MKIVALLCSLSFVQFAVAQQCVPYARLHSGIQIFGDAYTWWDKAQHKGAKPHPGAVMSMPRQGSGPLRESGHVAVVVDIVSSTEITIDHANWDGKETPHPGSKVKDISGNWTRVQVESAPGAGYAPSVYVVNGFIYPQGMTESNPVCNLSSWKCSTRVSGRVGWFPPVSDCSQASQWFELVKDVNGDVASWRSVTASACPQACFR